MPQDRTKIRVGPGRLLSAVVGATEPTSLDVAFAGAWTDLGYTNEGSQFTISPQFEDVEVAEEFDPVDILQTGRQMTLELALAQITAENLQFVMNGGTLTTNSARTAAIGTTTTTPTITSAALFDPVRDVGAGITGTGIPASTTILSVQSASSATMSANATATGSPTATITRTAAMSSKKIEPAASTAVPTFTALAWEDTTLPHFERLILRRCLQTGDVEIARRKAPDKATIPASFRVVLPVSGAPFSYEAF